MLIDENASLGDISRAVFHDSGDDDQKIHKKSTNDVDITNSKLSNYIPAGIAALALDS